VTGGKIMRLHHNKKHTSGNNFIIDRAFVRELNNGLAFRKEIEFKTTEQCVIDGLKKRAKALGYVCQGFKDDACISIINGQKATCMATGFEILDGHKLFDSTLFTKIDLSGVKTDRVTDMSHMFSICRAKELNLSGFDTSKVKNMFMMFDNCKAEKLDLSSFDTSHVKDMRYMFSGCKLETFDCLSNINTSSLKKMYGMLWLCETTKSDIKSDAQKINMKYKDREKLFKMQEQSFIQRKLNKPKNIYRHIRYRKAFSDDFTTGAKTI
jgi:surface protein